MRIMLVMLFICIDMASGSAQVVRLQGRVIDAETNEPIIAATIGFPSKNIFFPSNDHGESRFADDRIKPTDSVTVLCIGYQTQTLTAEHIRLSTIIKLQQCVTALQEVKIDHAEITVGNKLSFDGLHNFSVPKNGSSALYDRLGR